MLLALTALAATGAGLLLYAPHPGAAEPQYAMTMNVYDSLSRTVAQGLGTANMGGAYSVSSATAKVSVTPGEGHIVDLKPGNSVAAHLPAVNQADEQLRATFRIPVLPTTGNGLFLSLLLRDDAAGSAYFARVRVGRGGVMRLSLLRRDRSDTVLAAEIALANVSAGQEVVIDGQALNQQSGVVVKARAWVEGKNVPDWQLVRADTSDQAITDPAGVGLDVYQSRGTSEALPVTLDNLVGWALKQIDGSPTPTPTPSSTSSSSSPSSSRSSSSAPSSSSAKPSPTSSASPTPTPPTDPTPAQPGRGSAPIGSTKYPIPSNAVFVSTTSGNDSAVGTLSAPLRTVTKAFSVVPYGGTIVLRGGVYHEALYLYQDKNVTIQSYPLESVWFDGSTDVTDWRQSGSTWVHSGWNAVFDHSASFAKGSDSGGFIDPAHPIAAYPDQAFVDGRQLDQVAAGKTPGPGQFAVNTSAHTITLGQNPAGHEVRASDLQQAFVIGGRITLRGFGVRRYATSLPQMGTVYLGGHVGQDRVENLVIDNNATQGLSVYTFNVTVNQLTVTNNGMTGIHASRSDGLVVENSFLQHNNAQYFKAEPSAAAMKFGQTRGLTVTNNDVRDTYNEAYGIWTDQSVVHFAIANNSISNQSRNIQVELSDTGVIANNTLFGGRIGIEVFDTGNVKVFNNSFTDHSLAGLYISQDWRREANASIPAHDARQPIPDPTCPWIVRNITGSNNIFGASGPGELFQLYALDHASNMSADYMNIVVHGNQFIPRQSSSEPSMIGWGAADNHTLVKYDTPAAFNAGTHHNWSNVLLAAGGTAPQVLTAAADPSVPIPSDVAAAIGVPDGTRHLGTF